MTDMERVNIVKRLERNGQVKIGGDIATVRNCLVYIETKDKLIHPFSGNELDNPMTWDTFTYFYLLTK